MSEIKINYEELSECIASLDKLMEDFPSKKIDTNDGKGAGYTYDALIAIMEELNNEADSLKLLMERTHAVLEKAQEMSTQTDEQVAGAFGGGRGGGGFR